MVLTDAAVAAPNKEKALFRIGKVPFPYWEQPQRIQPEPLMAQSEATVAAPIRTKHVSLRKMHFPYWERPQRSQSESLNGYD